MRGAAKALLLGASLAWLAGMGLWGLRVGVAPQAIAGWFLVVLGYAALGALSYGGPRLRQVAAGGALCLVLAVLWATFAHVLLALGGLGVAGACVMPGPARRP